MRHLDQLEWTSYHLPAARSDQANTLVLLDRSRQWSTAFRLPLSLARLREYSHIVSEFCHYSPPASGPNWQLSVPASEIPFGIWRDQRPIE